MEPVFRALEMTAKTLVKAQGLKLDFTGLDKLPTRGGVVLAINHTGYLDFLPVALGVHRRSFEIKGFKSGVARMSIDAQAPIVPPPAGTATTDTLVDTLKQTMQCMLLGVQEQYEDRPAGAYWVPARLGGAAPTLEEAEAMDMADAAARAAKRQDG